MRKTIATVLLATAVVLGACSNETPSTMTETTDDKSTVSWPEFAAEAVAEYYEFNPESAVNAGLHEYDGRASDLSAEATREYITWLETTIANAEAIEGLEGIDAFERDYLVQALRGSLYYARDSGFQQSNPVVYMYSMGFSVYVDREYAPIDERIAAYTRYIGELPRMLGQMRDNLEPPLASAYVQTAHGMFSGLAGYLENTVPGLFAEVDDEELQQSFSEANAEAVAAVRDMADWLDSLRETATDDYPLGAEGFLTMLRETEGVDISLDELKAAGEADLERNLAALEAACEEYAPGEPIADCVLKAESNKPEGGAVAGARRQLPDLKQFLLDKDLVSIPGTEDALVDEAPPHRRFNAAYISIPGPFEEGLPSVYYIAPPDPEWSEEDQLAYIPGEANLLAISVHEVWPGHFLQFLHANRAANRIGPHFGTYTFSEGWAHYTEEMVIDAGLNEGDPETRIGQLLNALLRNVRYMSAIGLHAEGMSVEESQAMFAAKAFQDFGNASQQALRGTYDPGYLNYTLGKLMINKLRDDWTAGRGGKEAWKAFHDEFLSYGSPPIPLIRQYMLGDDYTGDDSLL